MWSIKFACSFWWFVVWTCYEKSSLVLTNNENKFKDLGFISVKFAQTSLEACITWPKESSIYVDNFDFWQWKNL
jgi:hypothetical protein